jgi:ketosteroid isomerase-like protein
MSNMSQAQLIEKFYGAFGRRDAATMGECYHPELRFTDPAFPDLNAADARKMWTMLCKRGKDLQIKSEILEDKSGSAKVRWIATYTFSQTGRKVVNDITAELSFKDGLIVRHIDRFDLYRWARQAFGPIGWILGWSGMFRNKVQAQAKKALTAFGASD